MILILMLALAAQDPAPPVRAPARQAFQEPPQISEVVGDPEAVLISPPFRGMFLCGEHAWGDSPMAGDALGTDCMPTQRPDGVVRLYRTDGLTNEDWYGWGVEVLAPFDGEVVGAYANATVNAVGTRGRPPAGMIQIRRADGVIASFAHVVDYRVQAGDRVTSGQPIALVGNNGPSFGPHVHIGLYRGTVPLQIRWDQRAMQALRPAD